MRPIEKMRADAWAAINNYRSGPFPMSSEDVLDLLDVVEAADGLAEACRTQARLAEAAELIRRLMNDSKDLPRSDAYFAAAAFLAKGESNG